jgi:integrase
LRASEVGTLRSSGVDLKKNADHNSKDKGSYSGVNSMRPEEVRFLKSYLKDRQSPTPDLFTSNRHIPISRQMPDDLTKKYGEAAGKT